MNKVLFVFFFCILPLISIGQDRIILNDGTEIHGNIMFSNVNVVRIALDKDKIMIFKASDVESIDFFSGENDTIYRTNGKINVGHIYYFDEKTILFKDSRKGNISIHRGTVKKIYPNNKIFRIYNIDQMDAIWVNKSEEKILNKVDKESVRHVYIENHASFKPNSSKFLIGYNMINEVHLGYNCVLNEKNAFEFQVGYFFQTRKYLMYDEAGNGPIDYIDQLFMYFANRQINSGVALRAEFINKLKGYSPLSQTFGIEYQRLESGDIISINRTGYSEHTGKKLRISTNSIGLTYGWHFYATRWMALQAKGGLMIDYQEVNYLFQGDVNRRTGETWNPSRNFEMYTIERTLPFPFLRLGVNFYIGL